MESMTLELRLLLACARVVTTRDDEGAIRRMLGEGVDWTLFVRKAVAHGLAGLAGYTLARVASDTVPADILDAFHANLDQTRRTNRALFDELALVIEALAKGGVEAIPFKGPILAIQAYGDLGLRVFRDLDFLIRDPDIAQTIAILHSIGYERAGQFTAAQFAMIHRIQGQEIIFKQVVGTAVEPHSRLTPMKMALDIDYAALWHRAIRANVNDRSMLSLAPEDDLVILAIHGGKEMWWNIKWASDVAAFISSHPKLDWAAIAERARAQGCLRMVLLATALARRYFEAAVPGAIAAAEIADPIIEPMVGRIAAQWQADQPVGPPSNKTLSIDRLQLHDGIVRRARYVMRTLLLPGVPHISLMPLPSGFSFVYVPIKLVHDFAALPLWRAYRQVLAQAGPLQDVLAGSDLTLAMIPASAETKRSIKQHQKMRAEAKRALAVDPNDASTWRKLGDALAGLRRHKHAIACYDRALALEPDAPSIWSKRAAAMRAIGRKADLPDFARDPQDAKAWAARAGYFLDSKSFAEAAEASDRAIALDPENFVAARMGIRSRLFACEWQGREDDKRQITEGVRAGRRIITPLFHRAISDSEAEHLVLARLWASRSLRSDEAYWRGERYRHDKIHIAYISTDFRDHVVSDAIAGCFEHHDKGRFETMAVSLGPDDGSEMRRRIEATVDRFTDVQSMNDAQVAAMLREFEIDIAIDLNGNSGEKRTGILARRPAPVQVNYLGYPGTMGGSFIDYIVADSMVIPEEHQLHYSEKVVYLPHAYLPNDRKRPIAERTPSRTEAGLPETGFVFACHSDAYKITPEMFDVWMRLLGAVEGSVLWLRYLNTSAMGNLWREAQARGVAPERLVYAPRVPRTEDHLARLRLADLFLDTLPYNAHATACDALWAGLPLVTCPGNTFAGRVAASLLYAIGLPELVTASLAEYEELARTLAQDPKRLAAIKAKLMRNRHTESLFDTARFTRDLEAAYTTMWEKQQAGLPPTRFAVST